MTPPVFANYQRTAPVVHPEIVALLDILHDQTEELSRLRRAALLPAPGVVS